MKHLQVYDDAHRSLKILAATQDGGTVTMIGSQLIRHGVREVEAGRLILGEPSTEPQAEPELAKG